MNDEIVVEVADSLPPIVVELSDKGLPGSKGDKGDRGDPGPPGDSEESDIPFTLLFENALA